MYSFSIVVIENLYIQTSLMVALSLFRVKEGGGLFINQRWTLLGISSSQLTFTPSFFRGVGQPPTSCDFILFHVFHVSNWLISSVIPGWPLSTLITSILDVRKVSYASITQLPIGSMYGIYANIWGILMVNVTILWHAWILWAMIISYQPVNKWHHLLQVIPQCIRFQLHLVATIYQLPPWCKRANELSYINERFTPRKITKTLISLLNLPSRGDKPCFDQPY